MTVSMRDVAAHAGVSVGTVSAALNGGEVAKATSARVWQSIVQLGYVPNGAARQLRAGKSTTFGLIVPDLCNPFYSAVSHGVQDRASEGGFIVLVGVSRSQIAREQDYIRYFAQQRVAGVIVIKVDDSAEPCSALIGAIPQVLVGQSVQGHDAVAAVLADNVEGGRLAVSHLLGQGRRNIIFVGGDPWPQQVEDRLRGARIAIAEAEGASLTVFRANAMTMSAGMSAGSEILTQARPDAIFAANDLLALGILEAFRGADNVRVLKRLLWLGMTTLNSLRAGLYPSQPFASLPGQWELQP